MTTADSKKSWTLQQWLSYLETLHPSDIELGLERVATVAARLDLANEQVTVITVAGTNGKGTSSKLLAAALALAGKNAAVFSSPHLLDFCERIALPDALVTESELIEAFVTIEAKRGDVALTYFEITTLAALLIFSTHKLDYWILEVGLGGRLDAVNVIDADIALVTSIAIDHCDYLGHDRETIGFEKAGIFRPDQIAVCADPKPPISLLQHAQTLGARLHVPVTSFSWCQKALGFEFQVLKQGQQRTIQCDSLALSLHPDNVVAVMHISELLAITLTIQQWQLLLTEFSMAGRWQQIHTQPEVFVDVAHNVAAAENLTLNIANAKSKSTRCICVLGMLADKQVTEVMAVLARVVDQIITVDLSHIGRGLSDTQLAALAPKNAVISAGGDMARVQSCLANNAASSDVVVITGSFYTVQAAIEEWIDG